MQLQTAVNSLAVNTYQSLSSASVNQPAVTGTVAPSAPSPEKVQSAPPPLIVPANSAGAELNGHSEDRQRFNKDSLTERSNDKPPELSVSDEELRLIRELAALDREVRQKEISDSAVSAGQTNASGLEYERGPDGRSYVIGGEVSIDTSAVPDDPEAVLEKTELILRAAQAVAEPSSQDRAAADRAVALGDEARAALNKTESGRQDSEAQEADAARNDAAELREALRSEKQQRQFEEQLQRKEVLAEKLQDFNQQLEEVNQRFAEINQLMIDAGVFKKLFPEGTVFDQIV
ncbi:putative metalloprotease CJM1_0395 family protein [Amphritea sp. HPY]|uniref:putative metalloprotease CJM1_0395 family protein n=1 Tax=Amphritea sp. HPY TaxID=3421652 RepID=UPI003D7E9A3E